MRYVAGVEDAVLEFDEIERERVEPRKTPVAIGAEPFENRRGQVCRNVGPYLQIVAEENFLAAGANARLGAVKDAVYLAEPVDEIERVSLVAGDRRTDIMARLLPVVEVGVKADVVAEVEIGAERVTLLQQPVVAGLYWRRERR